MEERDRGREGEERGRDGRMKKWRDKGKGVMGKERGKDEGKCKKKR